MFYSFFYEKKYFNLKFILLFFFFLLFLLFFYLKFQNLDNNIVNVYTHRHYEIDQKIFDIFTKKTGIKVNVINANADELIHRLEVEGKNSPADVLITVDAGRLERAKSKNLFQPVFIKTNSIPNHFRDSQFYWFGITYRSRIIVYSKDRVNSLDLSTYEDLSNLKWKGRILMRSSENIYNQSLLSSIIIHNGEDYAKKWALSIVNNMARTPKGNDKDQIKAISSGIGDVAVVNSYYVGKLINSNLKEERNSVNLVSLLFPNQNNRGSHVNISGVGLSLHAPNKKNGIKLMKFLLANEAQGLFSRSNFEYPVKSDIKWDPLLESWGFFKLDSVDLSLIGKYNKKAVKIFDEVGWK